MKYYKVLMIIFLTPLLISCRKDLGDEIGSNTLAAKTILNEVYGSNAAQVMDIYLPANRTAASTKVMVLIHGGGWNTGDKNDALFAPFVDSIRRRLPEYAVFNINYRLSARPSNIFPTQEMDVKSAVDFIFARRNEYGISDKFVFAGASAGAQLAMLQAYKYPHTVKAKAVVSFFGPSDLLEMYNNPAGGNLLISAALADAVGKTPAEDPLIYSNSSPLNFIALSTAMPTILLHGGLDPLVKPAQSTAVYNKLVSVNIATKNILYPMGGHGDWNAATYTDAFNNVQAFLQLHVP